ncbi:acetyl/propionyl/methylcrotonyl-CoA carboxylase subunit alpha [Agromyces cerinus]|uniref:biotin carboxylase n=1 Tax=Agromyces cerinus subsp. cerinus TaxID=232089 RepID=A0A1N6H8C5_9MICO|nr:biotin carboxylase N-terminal domain-containing protein [Agromyces cerinus]SIO16044.1 acetyl-CoA/propionyl-CoA carboxylase, biotin carboxylase, biotin carboxyl carrier protein [Agromyces cerinus subsp. cerinus]
MGTGDAGTEVRSPRPFERVLVANRGEIAVRVIRTLRRLGIRSIAVFSAADADAPHVRLADEAVRIGPASAAESYLDPARIIAAARETGAQAIHPGYGFLSEHAGFAEACRDAGIVFVGPGVDALEVMGDKIRAKRHVEASGVPTVPGVSDPSLDDAALAAAGEAVGFPLLVKPSAGGGGKGMQIARDARELAAALPAARRVALAAFGDDTLLLERLIERPRHIEVQVLADDFGNVIHLGERECSLQRRHQKVIEEAPSPLLDVDTRARIGKAACDAARSVDYRGAGTVEFLVSDAAPDEFFFIEMNTRLQVEHPVTELVTGVDLVEQQLRVAAGQPLALQQAAIELTGHAIEARVYAESPERGFLPSIGELLVWREPSGDGVRVDGGIRSGQQITADYDPMLAKVIAYGADRAEALARLDAALADTVVLGVETNLGFLRRLLADPAVQRGDLDTGLIDRMPEPESDAAPPEVLTATAAYRDDVAIDEARTAGAHAWRTARGWRLGRPAADAGRDATTAALAADVIATDADDAVWLHTTTGIWRVPATGRRAALDARLAMIERGGLADPELRAPMPGTVTAVLVADGDAVLPGDAVIAIEAMKMEHRVTASVAGIVRLAVAVGEQVSRDQSVARVEPQLAASAEVPTSVPASSDAPHEGAVPTAPHQE